MFTFLGFIFIFVFFIILLILSIIGKITRTIFGIGRRVASSGKDNNYSSNAQQRYQGNSRSTVKEHKKVFDKDEGEYVDFEEIKED